MVRESDKHRNRFLELAAIALRVLDDMRDVTIKCDGCLRMKGPNNHWFAVDVTDSRFGVYTWGAGNIESATFHLCGDQCLAKKMAEWCDRRAEKR